MIGTALGAGSAALALAGVAALAHLRRPLRTGQTGDLRLHAVAPGAYLWRGYFSNAAVLALPHEALVVDTLASPHMAARLRRDVERQLDLPIGRVVLTHFHGDHVGGSSVFADLERVASARTAEAMATRDDERAAYAGNFGLVIGDVPQVPAPTRTFAADREILDIDGTQIELLHLGAAETRDAVTVWWPERGVVCCGDTLATAGMPFTGAPICDEGLQDDGAWQDSLRRLRALQPEVLLPGHGPPLIGRGVIAARIDRVIGLYSDVLDTVRAEKARGGTAEAVVERSLRQLERYQRQSDLPQNAISLRMTVLRAYHAVSPERRGRGWWDDIGPRCLPAVDARAAEATLVGLAAGLEVRAAARRLANVRRYGQARDLLHAAAARDPAHRAAYLGDCAWWMFGAARRAPAAYEGADALVHAGAAATEALAADPSAASANLALGTLEVLSALMLGQPMERGLALLTAALAAEPADGGLDGEQRRAARFFIGKAHQFEERDAESDRWLRAAMPVWARPLFPLFRDKLRSIP